MLMLLQVDYSLADLGWAQLGDSALERVCWAWLHTVLWIQACPRCFHSKAQSKVQWHRGHAFFVADYENVRGQAQM